MDVYKRARMLVLCKTYPSPSRGYVETSCVATMTEAGQLIRLYPVPFRLLDGDLQFKKWQWIEADIAKVSSDQRPESRRARVDTLQCVGDPLSTYQEWTARRPYLERLRAFGSFDDLDRARQDEGVTLGLLTGQSVLSLEVTPARQQDWTAEELAKLSPAQGDLFSEPDRQALRQLRKLPYDFHYHYRPKGQPEAELQKHKIVDWEAGALYWNVCHSSSDNWESAFRQKYETDLPGRDLMLLMGTIHRFPDQWQAERNK